LSPKWANLSPKLAVVSTNQANYIYEISISLIVLLARKLIDLSLFSRELEHGGDESTCQRLGTKWTHVRIEYEEVEVGQQPRNVSTLHALS